MGGQVINTPPLGIGQTWQNVTASRAFATDYVNTTGRPIMVSCFAANSTSSAGSIELLVNGVTMARDGDNAGGNYAHVSAVVPAGATYRLVQGNFANSLGWHELR